MQESSNVHKILVAYKTKAIEGVQEHLPEFRAPAHYKDKVKIAEDIEKKRLDFLETVHEMPYTGTFEEIILSDPQTAKITRFAADTSKPLPSVRCCRHLLSKYPNVWRDDLGDDPESLEAREAEKGGGPLILTRIRRPRLFFIGFDPRTFLKMLGLECSMPGINVPCPLRLWYENSDHRDIAEAVMPKDYAKLTLPLVLKFRRPVYDPDMVKIWDEKLKTWTGPGHDPQTDIEIVTELASQLGFLNN